MEADKRVIYGVRVFIKNNLGEVKYCYVKFGRTNGRRTDCELTAMVRALEQIPRKMRDRVVRYEFNRG